MGMRKTTVLQEVGALFTKRRGGKQRRVLGLCKKSTPPKPLMGESLRMDYPKFLQEWSENSEFLQVCAICWSRSEWAVALMKRRRKSLRMDSVMGDPLGHNGRESSPSWSTMRRQYTVSTRTRDLAGTYKQPSYNRGQRHAQRVDKVLTAFCCASP